MKSSFCNKWGGAILCFPLALGCEGMRQEANAEAPVWKNRAGWVMHVDYSKKVVAPSRKQGEPYERGEPEIDSLGRRVFVGSSDGGLYAISAPLGETIWRFQTLSFVQSAPLYDAKNDVLYFGSHDGALYKVEAGSGKLLWRMSTQAEVARRPVLSGNTLYFVNANDTLMAVDAETGALGWAQHHTPAMGMEVAGHAGPAVSDGLVYVGFSDGTATAYDAVSGEERWQPVDLAGEAEEVLGEIPTYLDVDTTPELVSTDAGMLAIFGSYEGGVYALDAKVGTMVWSNSQVRGVSDVSMWSQPSYRHLGILRPERRLLLVSTGVTGLWALDPENGASVWQRTLPAGGVSRPVPVAGAILVNATQMGAFLLSPIDGSLIDGIHLDLGVSSTPAAYGNRAYVLTNGGSFISLQINAPSSDIPDPSWKHQALEGF